MDSAEQIDDKINVKQSCAQSVGKGLTANYYTVR